MPSSAEPFPEFLFAHASPRAAKLAGLVVCLLLPISSARGAEQTISCKELRHLLLLRTPGLVVLDVRSAEDFKKGHIQGARNVLASGIETAELPKDGRIVVYCDGAACPLSAAVADRLASLGYSNVSRLDGGMGAWVKEGYAQVGASRAPRGAARRHVPVRAAQARLERGEVTALDVRPALEFSAGHIPNARNIPLEQLDAGLAGLGKDKDILVCDRDAKRAGQAVEKLKAAGYSAAALSGGMAAWVRAKQPVEVK